MASRAWVSALVDRDAPDPVLVLLTISHASWGAPIRLVSAWANVTSRGATFLAYPFSFSPPSLTEEDVRPARLRIDNVHADIAAAIDLLGSPPSLQVELVLASTPDAVEEAWGPFELGPPSWTATSVEADLLLPDDSREAAMRWHFTPATAPGLFA